MLSICCQIFCFMCTLCVLKALFWKIHTDFKKTKKGLPHKMEVPKPA